MNLIKSLAGLAASAGVAVLVAAGSPSALAQTSRRTPPGESAAGRRQSDNDRHLTTLRGRLAPFDGGSEIGVSVRDLKPSEADAARGEGVAVEEVEADGPAAKGGLERSDLLISFDGERVRSARQFARLVAETPAGRTVKATVVRNGQRRDLEITPKAREAFGVDMNRLRERLGDLDRYAERLPPMAFEFGFDAAPRWRLGITVSELGDQLAVYFGASEGGVLVASVRDDSPAARAGLKAGDVITTVDGNLVRARADLVRRLRDISEDAPVTLGIIRERKAMTIKVEPGRPGEVNRADAL